MVLFISALSLLTIVSLLFLLDKKKKRIHELELVIYQEKLEKSRTLVKRIQTIQHGALILKNYAQDVSNDFLVKNPLFEDVYQSTKELIRSTKNISELLYVLGDIKAICAKESLEHVIWEHVYHDVRTHTELLVEAALRADDSIYVDVTVLFQSGIVRSDALALLLQKYQKRTTLVEPQQTPS